ncbi:MAG: hypothetical protein A2Z14_19490 [Chloroflexi bacterium RBG_16_48_8]|nr:MAG: hypothetical protein A2Z14_19490 [Chloroflexi bacterium RBG_16_48_8]
MGARNEQQGQMSELLSEGQISSENRFLLSACPDERLSYYQWIHENVDWKRVGDGATGRSPRSLLAFLVLIEVGGV